jgi:hypothetical protein
MKRVRAIEERFAGRPRGTVFEIENDSDADAMIHAGWVMETDDPLTEEEEVEEVDLETLTVDDLRDMARDEGLPVSGTKAELIERLSAK